MTAAVSADEQVHAFLRTIAVPKRHRAPRTAHHFRDVEPTMVPTRWGRVAAWRSGQGPAALLVHGWEDDSSLWSPLVDELVARHRPLVILDLPAHGRSGGEWGVGFEGTDAITAVSEALGPIDAVVAHSAGCGATAAAIDEGWQVERAAFIAPPMRSGNRWLRYAERLGVATEVALAAKRIYDDAHGPARAAWHPRTAYAALDVELLVVQSRDDERSPLADTTEVISSNPRAKLVVVDGPTHRQTARAPAVIDTVADFIS